MADMLQFDKNIKSDSLNAEETVSAQTAGRTGNTTTHSRRRFSSDEVADIIRISLQQESTNADNSIDHDELITIGREVGVTAAQIDQAVQLLEEQQKTRDKEQLLWVRFKAHCFSFITVNLFCIVLNLVTGTDVFWAGYVLLGWGLFLLGHYAGLRYAPEFVQMAMNRTRLLASETFEEIPGDNVNVGFTVADASGLMGSEGLVFMEDDKVKIEYQTSDSVLGILKTAVKEASIAVADIATAKIEHKFWSTELVLQSRSLKIFRSLPGHSSGTLRLKINRQSGVAAQNLVDTINKLKRS